MEKNVIIIHKYNCLADIKSNYILKKIFKYTKEKITLGIILYNNKIKKRINKDINDYIKFKNIEIELTIYSPIGDNDIGDLHIKLPEDIKKIKSGYRYTKCYSEQRKITIERNIKSLSAFLKDVTI